MTKGYKATYNYKCRDQTYEIGQEYKLDYTPILCIYGFHYCKIAKNVLEYYPIIPKFKLLEIEDLSNDTQTREDKSCSNHIKIIREITNKEELYSLLGQEYTYDSNENELTYKDSTGFWYESTYNENNEELTFKNSDGFSSEKTYNENGQKLTYKNSDGFSYEYTYDSNGNELTYKSSNGINITN